MVHRRRRTARALNRLQGLDVKIPEEFQRQVEMRRLNPFHVRAGGAERGLDGGDGIAQRGGELDGDERAQQQKESDPLRA